MAVRLCVIMVQTPPVSTTGQQLAEDTIGSVIGVPGIDLHLIGPIASIAPSSTEYLSLESLSGDAVILAWDDPDITIGELHDIGFAGVRARHTSDPDGQASPVGRKIFAFNLSEFQSGAQVCEALQSLLKTRQTKTFQLEWAQLPSRQIPIRQQNPGQRRSRRSFRLPSR